MSVLSSAGRKGLPGTDFVFPGSRSFPINDKAHGEAAIREAKFAPDPGKVKSAVHRKFPDINIGHLRDDATHGAIMSNLK